jgi:hypothetical protein
MSNTFWKYGLIVALALGLTPLLAGVSVAIPRMHFGDIKSSYPVGIESALTVTIEWEGDATQYQFELPQITFPASVEVKNIARNDRLAGGQNSIEFRYTILPHEKGSIKIAPFKISYKARGEMDSFSLNCEGSTLTIGVVTVLGVRWWLVPTVIGSLALLVGGGMFWRRRRAAKRQVQQSQQAARMAEVHNLQALLELANKQRANGEIADFYQTAATLFQTLGDAEGSASLPANLPEFLDEIRYGGYQPPPEIIDGLFRSLEKKVRAATADQTQDNADPIALRED